MNQPTSTFVAVDCPDTANTVILLKIYHYTFESVQVGKLFKTGRKQFLKVKL